MAEKPKEKTPEEIKQQEDIKRLLESYRTGSTNDVLEKLGRFLSTPLDEHTLLPLESGQRSPEEENALNSILSILITILRLLVLK